MVGGPHMEDRYRAFETTSMRSTTPSSSGRTAVDVDPAEPITAALAGLTGKYL